MATQEHIPTVAEMKTAPTVVAGLRQDEATTEDGCMALPSSIITADFIAADSSASNGVLGIPIYVSTASYVITVEYNRMIPGICATAMHDEGDDMGTFTGAGPRR